jgi:hypothetical protein
MPTPHQPTPRWQPIASLPIVAHVIDGQLEAAEEQHRLLRLARPGSLDAAIVERIVRVYTEEIELLAIYAEQLDRWRSGSLAVAQRHEVKRLREQLAHTRDVDAAILSLAEQLKATTIDAILAKSNLELGLEVFTDRSPLFPRRPSRRPQP